MPGSLGASTYLRNLDTTLLYSTYPAIYLGDSNMQIITTSTTNADNLTIWQKNDGKAFINFENGGDIGITWADTFDDTGKNMISSVVTGSVSYAGPGSADPQNGWTFEKMFRIQSHLVSSAFDGWIPTFEFHSNA
jgi:hypothetical protein